MSAVTGGGGGGALAFAAAGPGTVKRFSDGAGAGGGGGSLLGNGRAVGGGVLDFLRSAVAMLELAAAGGPCGVGVLLPLVVLDRPL